MTGAYDRDNRWGVRFGLGQKAGYYHYFIDLLIYFLPYLLTHSLTYLFIYLFIWQRKFTNITKFTKDYPSTKECSEETEFWKECGKTIYIFGL